MSSKLQKLTFAIDLMDRVSAPVRQINKVLGGMAKSSQDAFGQIGTGAMGVAGAGASLYAFINPAEQMRQAIGEVASLDVGQATLEGLSNKALQYSIKYGRAADGFVRSAYDIQSAIGGLQGDDLAVFTNAGNVLATATKSDAGIITNYMGTMYGIFQNQADKMGKAHWVEQLTGQTATAVQMFKTTGSEFSSAFTSVGANATAAGIEVIEQMAILGKLQATMSGSEAGTKYKSFLAGVGSAQNSLGLSFVDDNGNMLGMLDILDKIKGKFGDTLEVAESDALKKAFGSDEAVSMIKLLMADTDGLATSMDKLGQVQGMDKATEMAEHMVTPLQRIGQGVKAVAIGFGSALNPALDPFINGMADAAAGITTFTTEFPNATRWIGYGVLTVLGLTATMGAFAMIMGVVRLATIGWSMATMAASGVSTAFSFTLGLARKSWALYSASQWIANMALWAFPGTWIVAALVGLVAAVGAAIYWWDDLKAAFMDTSWGQAIMEIINTVMGGLGSMLDTAGWALDKVGGLFGFGSESSAPASSSLDASKSATTLPGGAATHIANAVTKNSSNSKTVGKQEIHIHTPVSRKELSEMNWMEA